MFARRSILSTENSGTTRRTQDDEPRLILKGKTSALGSNPPPATKPFQIESKTYSELLHFLRFSNPRRPGSNGHHHLVYE